MSEAEDRVIQYLKDDLFEIREELKFLQDRETIIKNTLLLTCKHENTNVYEANGIEYEVCLKCGLDITCFKKWGIV